MYLLLQLNKCHTQGSIFHLKSGYKSLELALHFKFMMGIIHFPVQIEGVNKITFDKTRNFLTLLLFSVTVYHCLKISKWWATFCFKRKCVVYDEWQKSWCSLKNTTMWYYYYLSQQFMLHDFWIFLFGWFVLIVVGGFCDNAVGHLQNRLYHRRI